MIEPDDHRQRPRAILHMTFASAGLFELLGMQPILGRTYNKSEDIIGGPMSKAVISYSMWKDHFGGGREVLGKSIRLRGESFEMIGVMPSGFHFPERSQVWVPLNARYAA